MPDSSPSPWNALPPFDVYRLRFVAQTAQKLPPMPTTAFHGGLGHSLKAIVCLEPDRPTCSACPYLGTCPYPLLFEPEAKERAGEGVTERAPSPVVMSPERPVLSAQPLVLEQGMALGIRLTLVGTAAATHLGLVVAAFRRTGELGIGIPLHGAVRPRPSLSLDAIDKVEQSATAPDGRVKLRFTTPVRITSGGRVQGAVDGASLLRAMARRADTLARLYGAGPLELDGPVALEVKDAETEVVDIHRYSSRQKQRISMPGVIGKLTLCGDVQKAWPLIAFSERVQVGKGTGLGFGRFLIEAE